MQTGIAKELKSKIEALTPLKSLHRPKENFPGRKARERCELIVHFIIEAGNELLAEFEKAREKSDSSRFHAGDLERIIKDFCSDIERFATEYDLPLSFNRWSQNQIPAKALYHICRSEMYPEEYKSIELLGHRAYFTTESIPQKLRLALEIRIREIIGFAKISKIAENNERIAAQFPASKIIRVLGKCSALELPCSTADLGRVYEWACRFSHTGKGDYLWMHLLAIQQMEPLFIRRSAELEVSMGLRVESFLKTGYDLSDLEKQINDQLGRWEIMLLPEYMEESLSFYDKSRNIHI